MIHGMWTPQLSGTAIAILLALGSAVGYAGAAIVQERVAARAGGGRGAGWWSAVALNLVGALLHVFALRYAALTIVQPLGVLTLVVAVPLGALVGGRRPRASEWVGTALSVGGLAAMLSRTVAAVSVRALSNGQVVGLAAAAGLALAVLVLLADRAGHAQRRRARGLLLGAASGVAFGVSSVLTQTLSVRLAHDGVLALSPVAVLIGALSAGGLMLAQAAYRGSGLSLPLATGTLTNPVVAVVIGVVLLGERFSGGFAGVGLVLLCGALAAAGVGVLAAAVPDGQADPAALEQAAPPPKALALAYRTTAGFAGDTAGHWPGSGSQRQA
jgi:drug/metabolite transporter (DMT)-like permease